MENEILRIDYDGNWKWLIEKFPALFVLFFLPTIYPLIDFQKEVTLAKQEVHKLAGGRKKKGGMISDIILKVHLKDGARRILFIHIEVQSAEEENFGRKMFRPFYWLYDLYGEEITALAIFVGDRIPEFPDSFEYKFGKTSLLYTYPIYVVKDHEEAELKQSDNIFALAVLACKHILATKTPDLYEDRFKLKLKLIDFIYGQAQGEKLDFATAHAIATFVENLVILPERLEPRWKIKIDKIFKKRNMKQEAPEGIKRIYERTNKYLFGVTVQEMKELVEKERKAKLAEKQKAEAEKQKAEAEKKRTVKAILAFGKMGQTAAEIARLLELDETYVLQVLNSPKIK